MNNKDVIALLTKYNLGDCTPEEQVLVETWYINHKTESLNIPIEELSADLEDIHEQMIQHIKVRKVLMWPKLAAAVILILSIGTYFLLHKKLPNQQNAQIQQHDIVPGSNKATLTLSNGQQLVLTGARNGKLALQNEIEIRKTADGEVVYSGDMAEAGKLNAKMEYNMMTTPVGGKYELVLSDGTKVVLDAASSIRYPVTFAGNERRVEITGQVYFEVAHRKAKPFRVTVGGQTVEVLGTHFNINAYDDEPTIATTLLEGRVNVTKGGQNVILKPGQQSVVKDNMLTVIEANTEKAVAWKNGYFRFNDEKIESIMRELSRWYGVEVKYKGKASIEGFSGKISRYKNISQVLKMLEYSGLVHFTLEERKVVVM
jgi:transmembrane sensor